MDEIEIEPYHPSWPEKAVEEVARLSTLLPPHLCLRIEHFGSTAVPGLTSKPVIDLLMAVRSLDEAKEVAVPPLEAIGYSFWRDNPDPTRMFLVKGLPPSAPRRTHHLHIVTPDSTIWERLLFRDYLRAHSNEAARYGELKLRLAATFTLDREAYTRGKDAYIAEVMGLARVEFCQQEHS